ncbi:MAG: glycosyltransferase, partial [Rhodocyclaceae bacterium]|nr:glycosyltransferase [Rhodocyclaceae bacterium]
MKSRRILFAVSSLSAGGAERVIAELANAFAGRGHAVAVLTLVRSDADQYRLDDRVERIALDIIWESTSIWQSVIGNIRRSLMIRRAVQAFGPDIVISFIEQTNVRMLAALPASGTPVVVSERVDPRRYRIGRSWILARRILYPLAAKVVVQTEVVALWAKNIVAAGRIHVIPNFVRDLPAPPPVATR